MSPHAKWGTIRRFKATAPKALPLSKPERIPSLAIDILLQIPSHFYDDGCSTSPDGYWKWACRIHDWWWCTRSHPQGTMTADWKEMGDSMLKTLMTLRLPWGLHWLAKVYYRGVTRFGGSFNTCGYRPSGASLDQEILGLCRHSMPWPDWMYARVIPRGEGL